MVEGTINGFPFRTALEPNGKGSHWLSVNKTMRDAAGADAVDMVTVEITRAAEEPEIRVPTDLRKALATAPLANPAVIALHLHELDRLPDEPRRQIRRLQRQYVEEWVTVLTVLLALLLTGGELQTLQTFDPNKIEDVVPRGNRRIPSATILYNLQTKKGDTFNIDTIRADVRKLYSLGYFDNITPYAEDGKTGLLVPPDDEAALGDAIARLLASEPLRRSLGAEAARDVRARFALEGVAPRYLSIYRGLSCRGRELVLA